MKEWNESLGYYLTTDTGLQDEKFGMTPALHRQLDKLYKACKDKKNKKVIPQLNDLIVEYPKCPILKNYLSSAYLVRGDKEKAMDITQWIITEHPDYLFGKLSLAIENIKNEKMDGVPELLGNLMGLKAMYPERDTFHLAEFTGYYKALICYFVHLENSETAGDTIVTLAPDP